MDEKSHHNYCSSSGTDIGADEKHSMECLKEKDLVDVEEQEKKSYQQQQEQQTIVDVKIEDDMSDKPSVMKCADRQEVDAQIEEGLQQLTQVLKSPDSPEQQIQIFNIFVNCKPLIGAFCDQEEALHKKLPMNPNAPKYVIKIFDIFKSHPSVFTIWKKQRMCELGIGTERIFEKIRAGFYTEEYLAHERQILDSMKKLVNQCKQCEYLINERYHCTVCDNFNLCPTCYEEIGHQHEMEKLLDKPPQEANKSLMQNRSEQNSMAILEALPIEESNEFLYNCSKCKILVETRYHCTVCDDFNLCLSCKEKDTHPHEMEKIGLGLDDGSSSTDTKPASSQHVRELWMQRCIQSLVHIVQCKGADCRLASCQRMKEMVEHTKTCKKRSRSADSSACPICKQFVALCCHHAKLCNEARCPVPFCFAIKQKINQHMRHQRRKIERKMAVLNTRPMKSTAPVGVGMITSADLIQMFMQRQYHQQLSKVPSLKQRMIEMNMVPLESNSTSIPKSSPRISLSSTSSTCDDINEATTSQQDHHSKAKPSLQKCVSFKKRGLLVRPQKRKFTALVKQSVADSLRCSAADFNVSAQVPTAENTDFEITTPQENTQVVGVTQLLETLNEKVILLTDAHEQQFIELKNMIQVVNEKIDNLMQ